MKINPDFDKAVMAGLEDMVKKNLLLVAPVIYTQVKALITSTLYRTPECQSLLAGDLRELFGIANSGPVIDNIVKAVADSLLVNVLPASGTSLGGIQVMALRSDYADVLGVDGASYYSVSLKTGVATLVPWLNWLLRAGDNMVVADWFVNRQKARAASRTGRAIMVKSARGGRGFRVPPQFSGVVDDNFLTRAFASMADEVVEIMFRAISGG